MPPLLRYFDWLRFAAASLLLAAVFLAAGSAHAVTIDMVTVGDAGNAADSTGYGAVGYAYQIGKYEVTIGQYVEFLNAVAKTDTYGLYAQNLMGVSSEGVISQAGSPGSYFYYASIVAYVPIPQATATNRPIAQTTWWQAARFANWMSNGQPTGAQGSATTENGAYPLAGKISGTAPSANLTNPNTGSAPLHRLPTENEWYKAAYYKSGGTNAGYWDFATQSDSLPGNLIGSTANQANYWNGFYSVTQSSNGLSSQNYLVDVGSFTGSPSAYGTFDQTGNAWELNDLSGLASIDRGRRGGAWQNDWANASAMVRFDGAGSNIYGGFRLAAPVAVPEPSTWVMVVGAISCASWSGWRRMKALA